MVILILALVTTQRDSALVRMWGVILLQKKIGTIILDDGMQHWSLQRNLEIVMVNGLTFWGNCHLIPRGPLREPLNALRRADVVVHQADMVSEQNIKDIDLILREINKSVPVFVTQMNPCYFFDVGNAKSRKPLGDLSNTIVLCVSAIGSANAFAKGMGKIGAFYVDRLEFSDHHKFQAKDYDRDPGIFKHLDPFESWHFVLN